MARSIFIALLFLPSITSAQVIISEIMYDLAEGSDSGREWIEVYNPSATPINLTELILFESNRKHTIKGEIPILAPFAYVVISDKPEKFRADYPSYAGLLFDSAFSLNNEGEVIEMRRGDAVLDSASYTKSLGGNGSGESLQRTSLVSGAAFSSGAPTPGASVPAGGLVRIMPVKAKTTASKALPTAPVPEVLGTQTTRESFEEFELENEAVSMTLWLLGVGAIAGIGLTGAVLGKKRDELDAWTIIEET